MQKLWYTLRMAVMIAHIRQEETFLTYYDDLKQLGHTYKPFTVVHMEDFPQQNNA